MRTEHQVQQEGKKLGLKIQKRNCRFDLTDSPGFGSENKDQNSSNFRKTI
uniref:Uncharacterized protein n=1 Tax=Anguilla anguilla TaxID=7936 RepID=A0A0E9RSM8_ANGAN